GMVESVNWIVVEKVCSFLDRHRELPLRNISVNLTSEQIMGDEFCGRLETLLAAYQLSKDKLRIEITERVMSKDDKALSEKMQQMWKQGYRFYLDDFGVGYSNIYNVMHLPFECVKLDKSLMDELSTDQANAKMVQEITKVFHDIGQLVVAEGIETEAQSKLAAGLGIDKIQGFYYARPMPEDQLLAFFGTVPVPEAGSGGSIKKIANFGESGLFSSAFQK
ncbi:MAG: EAL domain-containing protein, partial [Blautia sp.]